MTHRMTRREFLRTSTLAAAGSIAAGVGIVAAEPVDRKNSQTAPSQPTLASQPDGLATPMLPLRELGRTGVNVSILGLGGDGIISDSTDKDAVIKFVCAVLDSGVNFIDTGYVYGKDGRCEKNLGLVMGTSRRKGVFLATKTGARQYDTAMRQVETSMKRLRVDMLDLIQVHHLTDKDDIKQIGEKQGVLAAFRKLKDQKVVRFIGLTGHPDHTNVKKALEMYDWDTFMCFVNPARFSKPAMDEQLPLARKKGIGVIAMKTFGGRPGLLVGKEAGQADATSLLRFALSQDISIAIPGMATAAQLAENVRIVRDFKPLTAEEVASLTEKVNSGAKPWTR